MNYIIINEPIYLLLFLSIMPEINLYYLFLLNFGHKGNNKYK